MYEVLLHRDALKALERLPEAHRRKVACALDAMEQDPFAGGSDVRKLRGELEGRRQRRAAGTEAPKKEEIGKALSNVIWGTPVR